MNFKIGDRVRAYDNGRTQIGIVGLIDKDTKNLRVDGIKSQDCDSWNFAWIHPKQCRRLKPKRRLREWWLIKSVAPDPRDPTRDWEVWTYNPKVSREAILVREVLKPKP